MGRSKHQVFTHEILIAHGTACPYCGKIMKIPGRQYGRNARSNHPDFPTRDHVIPKSRMPAMGKIIVCRRCNGDKGNMTLDEWIVVLVKAADPRFDHVIEFIRKNRHLRLPVRPEAREVASHA